MNPQQLNRVKGDLYELIQENYCGAPKQILLQEVEHLFQYIKELRDTDELLRTKLRQLRKEL